MNCIANYTSLVQGVYFCAHPGNAERIVLPDGPVLLRDTWRVCCLLTSPSPHPLSFSRFPFSSSSLSFPTSSVPYSLPPPPL